MSNIGRRQQGYIGIVLAVVWALLVLGYMFYRHEQFENDVAMIKADAALPYHESAQRAAAADAAEKSAPSARPLAEGLYTAPFQFAGSNRIGGDVELTLRSEHRFIMHYRATVDGKEFFNDDASGTWSQKGRVLALDATSGGARHWVGGRYILANLRDGGGFALSVDGQDFDNYQTPAEISAAQKAAAQAETQQKNAAAERTAATLKATILGISVGSIIKCVALGGFALLALGLFLKGVAN